MAQVIEQEYLTPKAASAAYGRDVRTLKTWARDGRIRCLLIPATRKEQREKWMFESPSALHARTFGANV